MTVPIEAFLNYSAQPDLSPEETYVIELLIDRVKNQYAGYDFERDAALRKIRTLPSYTPGFCPDELQTAAPWILALHWISFQKLGDDEPPVRSLRPLQYLSKLQTLHLQGNEVSDLTPLRHAGSLRLLDLQDNPVTDFSPLVNCPQLQELHLDAAATADWRMLQHLPALTELQFPFDCLDRFQTIPVLPTLRWCDISCIGDTVESVEGFPAMPELRAFWSLNLATADGIDRYPLLENLVNFSLESNDLEPLAALKNLTHLNLLESAATRVAPLSALRELRSLWLSSSEPIGDFPALAALPKLHDLSVKVTGTAPAGLEALRKNLSNWDGEFLADAPRSVTRFQLEVVDEETFEHFNSREKFGLGAWDGNKEMLASEQDWINDRIAAALSRYLAKTQPYPDIRCRDFQNADQTSGARSSSLYLTSMRSMRHLGRVIRDIQEVMAHSRHDWIIFLQGGETGVEALDFKVWVYPDKVVAMEKDAAILQRIVAPAFRITSWLHQFRFRG